MNPQDPLWAECYILSFFQIHFLSELSSTAKFMPPPQKKLYIIKAEATVACFAVQQQLKAQLILG